MKYQVAFQNTNSDVATKVIVVDELDTDMIVSSKGIQVTTSHTGHTNTQHEFTLNSNGTYTDKLITTFQNVVINSASVEENTSLGYVHYDINILPEYLSSGTEICNTAKIYFGDNKGFYGERKTTNSVCSIVAKTLGVPNGTSQTSSPSLLIIGPNPASRTLSFLNNSTESYSIAIVNTLGKTIKTIKINSLNEQTVNVEQWASGVYIVYSNGVFAEKIVITK